MSNSIFPALPGLRWDVVKKPMWKTKIQESPSGKELRTAFMSYPNWKFTLQYEVLRADVVNAELQSLVGFYNSMNGSYDTFLYSDPTDNSVTAQPFGTGNGSTVSFQLVRTYGGFVEPIQNLNGAPSIYVGGVLKTVTADYTISSLGVVTFTSAPASAAALTWSGNFYYRCRFDQDEVDFNNFMYQLWELEQLEFKSVKL